MSEPGSERVVITLPSDVEIMMKRTFLAPAARVFEAFTNPEHVRHWYGFRTSIPVVFEGDVRPGGRWRYVTREADGSEFEVHGEYREVEPPSRVVYTEVFEMFPDDGALVTVTFEERDGRTMMTQTSTYAAKEARDMFAQPDMEAGANLSMVRIEEILATLVEG